MELKKSDKENLEKSSAIFFEIGLVVTLALILIAFEWTSTGFKKNAYEKNQAEQAEQEIIPITRQNKPKPKPPEPPKVTEILQIVNNDVNLQDELQLQDLEANVNTEVKQINYDVEEEDNSADQIFFIVEDMPRFHGKGVDAFRTWVLKRLKYPEIAAENGISGRVYIQFVVEPNGIVDNVKVIRGVDPSLDAEAVRVVKSSPKWTPGKQRGKAVRVAYTIPIVFVLQ